jgi:hypothetical protein
LIASPIGRKSNLRSLFSFFMSSPPNVILHFG